MAKPLSRGIRNNNPGNIRVGAPWQGLMPRADMTEAQAAESSFCVFSSPKWGIRAIAVTLITYQDKRLADDGSKIDTIREIIYRWAPPVENKSASYAEHVAVIASIGLDDRLDVRDYATMRGLVEGIITHENGVQPYDDVTIREGLKAAGVEVPVKPLAQSRTIKATQVTAGSVVVSAVASAAPSVLPDILHQAQAQLQPLVGLSDIIKYAFIAVALAGCAVVAWERIRASREGVQ